MTSRLVYYGARDYADQLVRGDGYHLLTPTAVVVWLVERLFPDLDRLHSIFELRERHTHAPFGDQLSIHVLQLAFLSALSGLSASPATGYAARTERWARFLVARDDAELDRLASEDPIMALAKQTLDELSQDPATRRLARERADAIKLYEMELAVIEAKGRTELLLKLLGCALVRPRRRPGRGSRRRRPSNWTPGRSACWRPSASTRCSSRRRAVMG